MAFSLKKIKEYLYTIKGIKNYRAKYYQRKIFGKKRLRNLRSRILQYYSAFLNDKLSTELLSALDFLRKNPVTYFPCNLTRKYGPKMVYLELDKITSLYFAKINGKRMYFKRGWTPNECIDYCYCIQEEQDNNSPHRYLSENFTVEDNDIVVDIGAAEGIFALDVIEKASRVYLFETDNAWIEALHATFAPWKNKVEIINKYLTDENKHNKVSIDSFFKDIRRPDFIKIDVDGNEAKVLKGCTQMLSQKDHLKLAICTYHKQEDEFIFSEQLIKKGFNITFSKGFFIYLNDELKPPYLRRGILRAIK